MWRRGERGDRLTGPSREKDEEDGGFAAETQDFR